MMSADRPLSPVLSAAAAAAAGDTVCCHIQPTPRGGRKERPGGGHFD